MVACDDPPQARAPLLCSDATMRNLAWLTVTLSATLTLALFAPACEETETHHGADGGFDCSLESRTDTWAIGLTKDGANGTRKVAIVAADPAAPTKGDQTWTV